MTRTVLESIDAKHSLGLVLTEYPVGFTSLATQGTSLPPATLEAVRAADGVILAPVDTYAYPPREEGGINPSAAIRIALDLYANIRPAKTWRGVPATASNMDLIVVRENTEGFYADRNMAVGTGEFKPTDDVALAVRKITRHGSMRIARAAFELARRRRRHVTVVHKANVFAISDGLFLECVHAVASEYPDVTLDESIIDAMAAKLVRTPDAFDVVVTTNMYGDILSDEATELAGGLGLGGALNAGDDHGVAQATHGAAPDIAGRGIANPAALMLSCAMLLEWLGVRHRRTDLSDASAELDSAIATALANDRARTPDVGGRGTTESFAGAVVAAL